MPATFHHDSDITTRRQRLYRELQGSKKLLWPSYLEDFTQPGAALDAEQLRRDGGFRQLDPSRSEAEAEADYISLTQTLASHDATFAWASAAFKQAHGNRQQCQYIGQVMLGAGMQVDGTTDKEPYMDGQHSCKELDRWLTMGDEVSARFKAAKQPAADRKMGREPR